MTKQTIELTLQPDGFYADSSIPSLKRVDVCAEGLREYFALPKNKKTIYIVLSTKPSRQAYKLKYEDGWSGDVSIWLSNGYKAHEYLINTTRRVFEAFLYAHGVDSAYVSLYY